MDLEEYQALAARTSGNRSVYLPNEEGSKGERRLLIAALGLTGEAGEVAEIVNKVCGHHHPFDTTMKDKVFEELGDTLYYVTEMCSALGFSLKAIAQGNVDKLERRYAGQFTAEKSINREDWGGHVSDYD